MNQRDNVADQLKELLDMYEISMDTLSKYLQLPVEQIRKLSEGDVGFLPEDIKYKVAVTVMSLRFFLKDCEQENINC